MLSETHLGEVVQKVPEVVQKFLISLLGKKWWKRLMYYEKLSTWSNARTTANSSGCLKDKCKTLPNSPKFHASRDILLCPFHGWLSHALKLGTDSACDFVLATLGFEDTCVAGVLQVQMPLFMFN